MVAPADPGSNPEDDQEKDMSPEPTVEDTGGVPRTAEEMGPFCKALWEDAQKHILPDMRDNDVIALLLYPLHKWIHDYPTTRTAAYNTTAGTMALMAKMITEIWQLGQRVCNCENCQTRRALLGGGRDA